MSNNLDFFGGQPGNAGFHAATPAPTPSDQRFGLTDSSWQPGVALQTPAPIRPHAPRRTLILVLAVALAGLAGGGYYVLNRPHPVPLPSSVGGLQRLEVHGGNEAAELKTAKGKLSGFGLHDVSLGLYADSSNPQQGLFVVAGHSSGSTDFTRAMSAMIAQSQAVVPGISATPITAGGTTLQCATVTAAGGSGAFCVWQGAHASLFAFGSALSAQDVGNDLAEVRTGESLN